MCSIKSDCLKHSAMDQITHSLSNLTLFGDDSLQSPVATVRLNSLVNSLVHTCHLLHHRNEQLCLENESLKRQLQRATACAVSEPNVCVPEWIK